jgi:hypothetical protein
MAVASATSALAPTNLREHGRGFTMEREDRYQQRGPLVIRREFTRSRHEMEWAAQAYAIAVPVVRKGLGAGADGEMERRQKASTFTVAVGRLA